MHRSRLAGFIIDCQSDDFEAAADFWSRALGCPRKATTEEDYVELATAPGEIHLEVQKVDHPSRVHIDIETDDQEAEVHRLEALGAKRLKQVRTWWVMEAPTGQRFCVVSPQRGGFDDEATVWE